MTVHILKVPTDIHLAAGPDWVYMPYTTECFPFDEGTIDGWRVAYDQRSLLNLSDRYEEMLEEFVQLNEGDCDQWLDVKHLSIYLTPMDFIQGGEYHDN